MKQLYIFAIFFISLSSAQAQFHFQGLKGIMAEYGTSSKPGGYYGLGYQSFLSDRFQFEITGAYRQGSFSDSANVGPYRAQVRYNLQQMILNETIDYSFLKLFNHLYINLGAGLTQAYGRTKATTIHPVMDSTIIDNVDNIPEFDKTAIRQPNKISVGGHVNILTEMYLSRYLTLLFRYRYTYFLKSHFQQTVHQTSIGMRFNL